jgi:hypothetical protein
LCPDWLADSGRLLDELRNTRPSFVARDCYQFADGKVDVSSEDEPFARRIAQIFGECATSGGGPARFSIGCQVRISASGSAVALIFDDAEPLDAAAFNLSLFPDRRFREVGCEVAGWRFLASLLDDRPFAAFGCDVTLMDRKRAWEAFAGHYILHRVLRLQKRILFFHASSVVIDGNGVMLAGPENSGKTTVSMTLATRGSAFFGDDIAAVRLPGDLPYHELIPLRRSVCVRPGPRAALVNARFSAVRYTEEPYEDGETRIRAFAADLFPSAPVKPGRLGAIFFLKGFAERPRVEPVSAGVEQVGWLTPLASSLWGVPASVRMLDFVRLLKGVLCFSLYVGGLPEETAATVEETVRKYGIHNPREGGIRRDISMDQGPSYGDAGSVDPEHTGA